MKKEETLDKKKAGGTPGAILQTRAISCPGPYVRQAADSSRSEASAEVRKGPEADHEVPRCE